MKPSIKKNLTYCLVVLAFFLNSSWAHDCVHHEMNITISEVQERRHHKHLINHAASDYKGIRMTFDYSNIQSSESDIEDYIKETLLPPVQSYFQAALKVIPRTEKIPVVPQACWNYAEIPESGMKDGYDGDLVIFVVLKNEPSSGYLAKATACRIDVDTKRPLVGVIMFNRPYITLDMKDTTLETDIATTQHEITHILGFSQLLYPLFINPETLQPLTGHLFNKTVNGVETLVLNVAPLTKRLRAHTNCPTIEGAYLENQGGSSSFGAHFERRIFYNEIMTASSIKDSRYSEFTLALLEGSGWYKVDYKYAEPMTYGKNAGCAFFDTKCINPETKQAAFKEFCSPYTEKGVTWTRRGFGICGDYMARTNPDLIEEFDYWGNKTKVLDAFSDNCPTVVMYSDADCEDPSRPRTPVLQSYEYYGVGAKAFLGTLNTGPSFGQVKPYGYCFKTQCIKSGDNKYDLKVFLGSSGYATCHEAGNLDISTFTFTRPHSIEGELQCPDPNDFCNQVLSEGYCKGNCYANGECRQDGCHCYEGWESYNCAQESMDDDCSRCDPHSNYTTCYGNRCICNPANVTCMCALGLKTGPECLPKIDPNDDDNGGSKGGDDDNGNTNIPDPSEDNSNPPVNMDFSRNVFLGVVVAVVVIIIIAVLCVKEKKRLSANDDYMLESQRSQGVVL